MAVHVEYTCDVCGNKKLDGDIGWLASRVDGRSTIIPTLRVMAFMDAGADDKHVCGPICLAASVAEYIETAKQAEQKVIWSREEDEKC